MNKKSQQQFRVSQKGDRNLNQDRCEIFERGNVKVLVLADGMGGHPKGEVAAQLVIDTCYHMLNRSDLDNFDAQRFIREVLSISHQQIFRYGRKKKPPIFPRSTAALVVIHDDMMQWSHMGDSRIYLFRHGRAHVRTMDHTRAEQMRLSGAIEDSDDQSMTAGRSGVSRCLGGKRQLQTIDITPAIRLQDDDIVLLCSDGVWSQLKQDKLEQVMLDDSNNLAERLTHLVQNAVDARHPYSDNATAVALCWHPQDQSVASAGQPEAINELDSAIDHLQSLIKQYQ
ncbi:MAG: protein phosphatase 2C domain-containing protein [Chromatiales bacterium]|jgi:serine/threonine protein phosphatase PrpC